MYENFKYTFTVIIYYKTVAYRKHLRYSQISIKTNSHHEIYPIMVC